MTGLHAEAYEKQKWPLLNLVRHWSPPKKNEVRVKLNYDELTNSNMHSKLY